MQYDLQVEDFFNLAKELYPEQTARLIAELKVRSAEKQIEKLNQQLEQAAVNPDED